MKWRTWVGLGFLAGPQLALDRLVATNGAALALGPLAALGIGFGAQLVGGIVRTASERARLTALRADLEKAIQPLEAEAKGRRFGMSAGAGSLTRRVTRGTLTGLSERNVLDSSIAGAEVAERVAPIEAAETARRLQSEERLAAAKTAIATGTSLPGYGMAFGGAMEDAGGLMALRSGMMYGEQARKTSNATSDMAYQENLLGNVDDLLYQIESQPRFQFCTQGQGLGFGGQ